MQPSRRFDLDWIRVLTMLCVFTYHTTMYFNPWGWHVKTAQPSLNIAYLSSFLGQFIMPMFFAISGISTYFALKSRSIGAFAKERVLRLVVPLLFGIVILSPFQVYVERRTNGAFDGSFISFLPHLFEGFYGLTPGGNFPWMGLHLWYCLVLFLYSMLFGPLFKRFRKTSAHPLLLLSMIVPLFLFEAFLNPNDAGTRGMGGWNIFIYLTYFVYGYYVFADARFRDLLQKIGAVLVLLAALTSALYLSLYGTGTSPGYGEPMYACFAFLRTLNSWLWILSILYLGQNFLNRNNSALSFWNQAVMPFYVLHQPVIVLYGYFLRDVQLSVPVKFLILYPGAFATIMILYCFIVRNAAVLRFVCGMKFSSNSAPTKIGASSTF